MFGAGAAPILVLSQNTKRDSGRRVQVENINAGKAIADVIRTCLGPRAMLKMLLDPMGTVVMTNDGNAILREIAVQHPAAKTMIEIARTQEEEVGDGTTSVIVLAGEMLMVAEQFLKAQIHPTVIIRAYRQALDDMGTALQEISVPVDVTSKDRMVEVINACIGTKFIGKWSDIACAIALDAVKLITQDDNGRKEIDIKRYIRVEKVPGGSMEESCILPGVMLNKDVTHPKMRRYIKNPRIILLDCPLEFKKGENQVNVEIMKDEDFTRMLQLEEEHVQKLCEDIIRIKPDVVFTEKAISDLAQHYFVKAGITAMRRVKKSDINRISRACGATVISRTEEIKEEDVGKGAGLFEIKKMGDEYFCFVTDCKDPKACTILLRGASKDILNETDRNLQDALNVARCILLDAKLLPGGGAVEMAVSKILAEKGKSVQGVIQWPYLAAAQALEVIPKTLAQNCGTDTVRTLTALRAKHAIGETFWGINGETGQLANMKELRIWEPIAVKMQVYKTAIETAMLLLRIDDIVSGSKKKNKDEGGGSHGNPTEESMKE